MHDPSPLLVLKVKIAKEKHSHLKSRVSDGFVWQLSKDPFVALLYDFDVGRADLKSAHKYYLDKLAGAVSGNSTKVWKICLEGRASRTGKEGKNLSLSRDRAYIVLEYITSKLPGTDVQKDWVGEEFAKKQGEPDEKENLFDRAVLLRLWATDKPKPDPPKKKPPQPKASTKEFRIRIVRGYTASGSTPFVKTASVGVEKVTFCIWDVEEKMAAEYSYAGNLIGLGLGLDVEGYSGSIYGGGGWSTFAAPRDWTLDHFMGIASLRTVGIDAGFGGPSKASTKFTFGQQLKHWYSNKRQVIPDIDTGEGFTLPSVGVSRSEGPFIIDGKPFPYEGP